MNVRTIKGNTNMEALLSASKAIGGATVEELERECEYLKAGIKAARGKIANAVDKQRAAKFIIKHRTTQPKNVVRLALIARRDAKAAEETASVERDRFLQQYRNFRNLIYISKSIALLAAAQ